MTRTHWMVRGNQLQGLFSLDFLFLLSLTMESDGSQVVITKPAPFCKVLAVAEPSVWMLKAASSLRDREMAARRISSAESLLPLISWISETLCSLLLYHATSGVQHRYVEATICSLRVNSGFFGRILTEPKATMWLSIALPSQTTEDGLLLS